jgi:hypothetical protein
MFAQRFKKIGPREEYRQQEAQRIKDSISLSEKFRQLKSLTVELAFYAAESSTKSSEMKYTVNLDHARSVFYFNCPNDECVRGNFDLSKVLATAVAGRRKSAAGESSCPGWLSKTTIDQVHCGHVLRYKLSLGY